LGAVGLLAGGNINFPRHLFEWTMQLADPEVGNNHGKRELHGVWDITDKGSRCRASGLGIRKRYLRGNYVQNFRLNISCFVNILLLLNGASERNVAV